MGANDNINYLAGNPVLIPVHTGGLNSTGRFRIYTGDNYADLVFEGMVFSASGIALVDVTKLFESYRSVAGVYSAKMATVDAYGVEYVDNGIVNNEYLLKFKVFAGGISKALQRKLVALNTNIFDWKLKSNNSNFFLTTRTNGEAIIIPENELLPLYYYGRSARFYIMVDGYSEFTIEPSVGTIDTLQAVDVAAIRESLITSKNKLVSVFDITTDSSYCCSVVVTDSLIQTEYFLKFRNSWGAWEKVAVYGVVGFTPTFGDITKVVKWDDVISDFVSKNKRKEVTGSFTASIGYKTASERLFVIDLLHSETVIFIAHGLEYDVNVSGELPELISTGSDPVDISLKIEFIDTETYFSDLVIESEYEVLATTTLENITSGTADIVL